MPETTRYSKNWSMMSQRTRNSIHYKRHKQPGIAETIVRCHKQPGTAHTRVWCHIQPGTKEHRACSHIEPLKNNKTRVWCYKQPGTAHTSVVPHTTRKKEHRACMQPIRTSEEQQKLEYDVTNNQEQQTRAWNHTQTGTTD